MYTILGAKSPHLVSGNELQQHKGVATKDAATNVSRFYLCRYLGFFKRRRTDPSPSSIAIPVSFHNNVPLYHT